MGRITIDQSHSIVAILATNANWEEVDFDEAKLQDLVIRDPKEAGRQFTAFLRNGGRVIAEKFPAWKTIKLGTGLRSADDFRKALKQSGCKIGDWGNDILGKPAFIASDTETEVDLVVVSVAELGFKEGATRKNIYNKAKKLGLELCPNEVGPQLRLQYKDQPKDKWLRIAMEPISGSGGGLGIFEVAHGGHGLWLGGVDGDPDDFWGGHDRFVFVCPRK